MNGIYHGRLVCDGDGNLLADEGEFAGHPVAAHEGSYVFVQPGELSHNARHEKSLQTFTGTVDESMTDDPDLVNAGGEHGNEHHFGPSVDDAHYDPDAPNSTKVRSHPDAIAPRVTGHTEAYSE